MAIVYPPKQLIFDELDIFSAVSKAGKTYYYVEINGQRFILPPFVDVERGFITLVFNLNQDNTYYVQYI